MYAIMVCIDVQEDDWIFVTEDSKGNCWDLKPVLFEQVEEAIAYAKTFEIEGKEHNVKVVSYDE